MLHEREDVIKRVVQEYDLLDAMVAKLSNTEWEQLVTRPETKDPWTVKDALAHITHWKANMARSIRRQPIPVEERGLAINDGNHLIYERWRNRTPQEVLAWHRQVQQDVLKALREAPDEYFNRKERNPQWPFDLDGHSEYHRVKDIEKALA